MISLPRSSRSRLVRQAPGAARPLRILMVASEGPPTQSGIARTIEYLRQGLTDRGHQVDVIAHPEIARVVVREFRLYNLLTRLPGLFPSLDGYDVIHLHGAVPTFSDAFLLATRVARTRSELPPLVYTHHCDIHIGRAGLLTGLYNRVHRQLSTVADQQVSTTLGYAARIGLPDDVAVIPLGIDLSRFATESPKDPTFTVLFAGQFRPYKGVRLLIRAMARVHGARLILAGRGAEEQDYRKLAAELGVDVEFHVRVDDAALCRLYQRAHVIALPSVTEAEAFGLVLLEGMAAGCVPVASDLPGVRDVLGRIGFTFPRNSLRGLVDTLRRLRDDPALVQGVASRARDRAAAFPWHRTVHDYERLFRGLVLARELRTQLASAPAPDATVPHLVASHIQEIWSANRAEVQLCDDGGQTAAAGGAGSPVWAGSREAEQAVGQHAHNTRESVLVEARTARAGLPQQHLSSPSANVMGVPLLHGSRSFGALVATRAEPFGNHERDALTLLARHVAPALDTWRNLRRVVPWRERGAPDQPADEFYDQIADRRR